MRRHSINTHRLTVVMAAMTLAVPFGGVAFAQGNGNGDERPQSAPGQEKKAENAATQSEGSASNGNGYGAGKSEKPAKASKPSKPAKPAKPSRPAKPAKPVKPSKPAKPANSHARAGKTTICHATGSDTNPYVTITISDNALKAHARHQNGEDIIPAPAGGCPKGEEKSTASAAKNRGEHGRAKVTICHATGSETNPYVKITIAEPAVEAHARHQDGKDIIPAPEGDCPARAAAAVDAGTRMTLGAPAPAALLPAPAAALLAPVTPTAGTEASLPQGRVLGEFAEGGSAPAAAAAPATALRRESGTDVGASLPFTGLDTWVLVALGLGALLAGVAFRRAATR